MNMITNMQQDKKKVEFNENIYYITNIYNGNKNISSLIKETLLNSIMIKK